MTVERGAVHTVSEGPDLAQLETERLLLAHSLHLYEQLQRAGVEDREAAARVRFLAQAVSVLADHVLAQR